MYHVSAQGVDERMINVHYYYYCKMDSRREEEMGWGGGGGQKKETESSSVHATLSKSFVTYINMWKVTHVKLQ